MAKKKASGGLGEGAKVRVRTGVNSPEFPDVSLAGWTGTVADTSGQPPTQKVFIEWDAATIAQMPADYVTRCEAQQLYHAMACLNSEEIELLA